MTGHPSVSLWSKTFVKIDYQQNISNLCYLELAAFLRGMREPFTILS